MKTRVSEQFFDLPLGPDYPIEVINPSSIPLNKSELHEIVPFLSWVVIHIHYLYFCWKGKMKTLSTSRTGTKLRAYIKQVRHDNINKEVLWKTFQRYCNEVFLVILNVKLLSEIMHTNCFGYSHDRPSQSEHECMMRDKDQSVGMYFYEIMKKVDFILFNH